MYRAGGWTAESNVPQTGVVVPITQLAHIPQGAPLWHPY